MFIMFRWNIFICWLLKDKLSLFQSLVSNCKTLLFLLLYKILQPIHWSKLRLKILYKTLLNALCVCNNIATINLVHVVAYKLNIATKN